MKKSILAVGCIYIAYLLVMLFIGNMFYKNYNKASEKPGRRHYESAIVLTVKN